MKKLLLFFLPALLAFTVFTSCSEDDEDAIIGQWTMTKVEAYATTSDQKITDEIKADIQEDNTQDASVYEFTKNNEMLVSGKKMASYSISDGKIVLVNTAGDVQTYKLHVDKNKLIMSFDLLSEYENYSNGVTVSEAGINLHFEKR